MTETTGQWLPLNRSVLAARDTKTVSRATPWHLNKGTLVRVIEETVNPHFCSCETRDARGKVVRVVLPTDAVDPRLQREAADTQRRMLNADAISEAQKSPSAGTMAQLFPELADWLRAALDEMNETPLGTQVFEFAVRGCWKRDSSHYIVSALPRSARPLIFGNADHRAFVVEGPAGPRVRSWAVSVAEVRGELLEVTIARPTILRPELLRVERELAARDQ